MKKIMYIFVFAMIIILGVVYFNNQPSQESLTTEDTKVGIPTVFLQSVINGTLGPASAVLSSVKTVTWQTSNYPANAGVNINLLKKTSDSPREFVIVRTIATETPNDRQETWTPQAGENSNNFYVEVVCSSTYQFKSGCKVSGDTLRVN